MKRKIFCLLSLVVSMGLMTGCGILSNEVNPDSITVEESDDNLQGENDEILEEDNELDESSDENNEDENNEDQNNVNDFDDADSGITAAEININPHYDFNFRWEGYECNITDEASGTNYHFDVNTIIADGLPGNDGEMNATDWLNNYLENADGESGEQSDVVVGFSEDDIWSILVDDTNHILEVKEIKD